MKYLFLVAAAGITILLSRYLTVFSYLILGSEDNHEGLLATFPEPIGSATFLLVVFLIPFIIYLCLTSFVKISVRNRLMLAFLIALLFSLIFWLKGLIF